VKTVKITKKNQNKSTKKINIFYPTFSKLLTPTEATLSIVAQIEERFTLDIGSYPRKELLISDLERKVFGEKEVSDNLLIKQKDLIIRYIEDGIRKVDEFVSTNKDVNAYVFPTTNKPASEFMGEVNAFALGQYSLYFFIDPEIDGWEEVLRLAIPHEYAHLASFRYFKSNTIVDEIVFEGLAEHTREHLYGGVRAKYSAALSRKEALQELKKLPKEATELLITEENYDLQLSYFFGTKDLPNWYGYSLGYWLIDNVLKTTNLSLKELFKIKPIDILEMVRE